MASLREDMESMRRYNQKLTQDVLVLSREVRAYSFFGVE